MATLTNPRSTLISLKETFSPRHTLILYHLKFIQDLFLQVERKLLSEHRRVFSNTFRESLKNSNLLSRAEARLVPKFVELKIEGNRWNFSLSLMNAAFKVSR